MAGCQAWVQPPSFSLVRGDRARQLACDLVRPPMLLFCQAHSLFAHVTIILLRIAVDMVKVRLQLGAQGSPVRCWRLVVIGYNIDTTTQLQPHSLQWHPASLPRTALAPCTRGSPQGCCVRPHTPPPVWASSTACLMLCAHTTMARLV